MSIISVKDENNFNQELKNQSCPVLVDFWAEWCGQCKALTPVLEEISQELGDQAKIFKVNVDENQELAQRYGIRGIPTLIFFKNGEISKTLVGNQPKSEILSSLKELNK